MKKILNGKYRLPAVLISLALLAGCASGAAESSDSAEGPEEIRLDYAYYSPTSLVLKEFGWAEEEFEEDGIDVSWTLSHGSNKALEFLNSNSVDFGSSAGAAALMSKANGAPIKNVYIYSQPEWTALVKSAESDIESIGDLKGKRVAATLGTDPYIFLLRAMAEEGLSQDDVEIVNVQHSDGATTLNNGGVDAWAGLDPHMARLEVDSGAELFYRNPDFNTYGFLNVREAFAEDYPEHVGRVIEVYEKAREWIQENPEEAAEILMEEAQIDQAVAEKQLERNDFSSPVPGAAQHESVLEAGRILQDSDAIGPDIDVEQLTDDLIDPSYAEETIESSN
ncbi:aliphatic sulfonate ABC transporter substrate-binding protein [Salinicoccus halitifaciens]|uniref:Sulfonate transport system substrate-binding protein n=1 Tax=Salinicoccus halitifaciens TaxID=1073415 RepID=A0ABV2E889_9STAP|nr:aliphatic sulfonate ABC transporter substrate-binding protein [Salinicoccus halitifaciens]MCD2137770.1 aliphatic sulfonate ABC transporter substrate-binding protein [Salinicoccus halitifaciens]